MEFIQNSLKLLSILSVLIVLTHGVKLNVPRILLPIFRSVQPNFLLEDIDAGCYTWSSTREDLITLTVINEDPQLGCSSKVLVSLASKPVLSGKTVVIGEDTDGIIVKCDVLVDFIDSLTISSTTKELYIDDIPEDFFVKAYNDQGNEFSSLVGVEFIWEVSPPAVAKYLQYKDSPYEAPKHIQDLEDQMKKGNVILIQGVETGTATITAILPYTEYKHINQEELTITVSANIILMPSDVYMMPGDTIEFVSYIIANSRMNRIDLKDYNYYIKADDPVILRIDQGSSEATALKTGRTFVTLASSRDAVLTKMPSVDVTVVQPAYMTISIMPHNNWVVLVGDQYDIIVNVYSQMDQQLNCGKYTDIKVQVGEDFHVEKRTKNGTWFTGWGLRESKVPIEASFENVYHPREGKFPLLQALTASVYMYVYPRIIVKPSEVILPWDPYSKPKFNINLTASGGDGKFLWSTTDSSKGFVTQYGQVRTIKDGTFEVAAAMARNHHNRQHAKIAILPPVRLEISEYTIEAAVGEPIFLHISMYALHPQSSENGPPTYIPITLCDALSLQIKLSDSNFRVNRSATIPLVGISCANIPVIADEVGTCKVTILYELSNNIMEDSVTISSYQPLAQVQPEGEVVLAVGASMNLFYEGGPTNLIGRGTTYQRVVVTDGFEDIIEMVDVTAHYNDLEETETVVWVLCRKLGQANVNVMVSNTPSLPNCKARPAIATTRIICGKPRTIRVYPNLKLPNPSACPMDLNAETVIIPVDQHVTFNVSIYDEMGRAFKNSSTYIVKWTTSHVNKIKFLKQDGVFSKRLIVNGVNIANGSAQIIHAKAEEGVVKIHAHLAQYNQAMLSKHDIVSEKPEFLAATDTETHFPDIKTTVGVILMNNTRPSSSVISVFNQPGLTQTVEILEGSGYVQLALSQSDLAEVSYQPGSRKIEITPLRSGEFTIEVQDLCLISEPTIITVKIITVGRITVEMAEKVEIYRCIEVVITLYDELDKLIDIEDIKLVKVDHRLSKHIADITLAPFSPTEPWPRGEIHYTLTGMELGSTEVVFGFDLKGREIPSNPVQLQVFEPLKLFPRNSTMLIGSIQQLSIVGGPYPDCNIEFVTLDSEVVKIEDSGVVEGLSIGQTRIVAKALGVHPRTGDKIIYAEDQVEIHVVELKGVKIASPLLLFRLGTVVPAWVTGIPSEITPVILGSFDNDAVTFEWSLEDNGVASISDTLSPLGINYLPSDRISIRLTALAAGKTKLFLNVTMPGNIAGQPKKQIVRFSVSATFECIEYFHLVYPYGIVVNWILMAPYSELRVETNFDNRMAISYSLPTEVPCPKSAEVCATDAFTNILSLTPDGLIKSTGKLGFSLLIITATDSDGRRRSLSYVIQVKPIHYMLTSIEASWRVQLDSHLNSLPVGTEFVMKHRFYDNMGAKFNAVPIEAKRRANRQDLIMLKLFKNNTSIAAVKKAGITVIKGWSDDMYFTADYVRLRSEEVIKPPVDFLVSGDMLCLWSPIVSRDFNIAKWNTSDPELVYIDHSVDIAYAIGAREGTVYLTNSLHPSVPIVLQILPPASIQMLPDPHMIITNGGIGSYYRIFFVIRSLKCPEDKDKNLIQGWKCDFAVTKTKVSTPFTCFVEFSSSVDIVASDIFKVKPSFAPNNARYNCKITVQDVPNPLEMATMETNLTVWAMSSDNFIESERLNITFLPNFYTEREIRIKSDVTTAIMDIIGLEIVLKDVQVEAMDPSIIFIDSGTFVKPTLLRYKVQVIDYHWKLANVATAMGISVTSTLTSQGVTVMVVVDDMALITAQCVAPQQSYLLKFLETYQNTLTILASVLIIFLVSCYVYSRYMQPTVNVNVNVKRRLMDGGDSSPGPFSGYSKNNITRLTTDSSYLRGNKDYSCSEGPIYGASGLGGSPELRRNRRYM